ncbi:FdhD protein [Loktanella fryxellensis]|uniref:Sulfur carrier protein FdhD n=1 Tax=Loktanella fryxellensis TaxID=245187 RepID=A0A1H8ITX3_9RHOB|nr:formate dehydrogenase accessory sulfurtransferase FdhD [Loktanella fryxellensis]SEN71595.1 FdhD protein [Loktanella fryxellensis]
MLTSDARLNNDAPAAAPASVPWTAHAIARDGAQTGPVTRILPEETAVAIVCNGTTVAVMMATPEDLADFATGFALTEGLVDGLHQIESLDIVPHGTGIEARLWLTEDRAAALTDRRRSMLGPVGCGLCGIDSLEQALRPLPVLPLGGPVIALADVLTAPDDLRRHQPLHDATRATHAAAFLRPGTGLVCVREDVGRHNALDKLIGALAGAGLDPATGAIVVTSRVSVDMVQKTVVAGCPVLIAVSSPTAQALRLADAAALCVVAHVRDGGCTIFTHPDRVADTA